ncbi:unnamed protein product [Caenorhabditis nigoni]
MGNTPSDQELTETERNEIERHRERTQTLWSNFEVELIEFKMANFLADQILTKIQNHPKKHERRMKKVRTTQEETVDNAVFYAAELTRKVECMERVDEQQKKQFKTLKKAGNAFIAENATLERKIARMKDELRFAKRQSNGK